VVYVRRHTGSDRKRPDDTIENVDMSVIRCAVDFAEDTIRRLASAV